MNRLLTLALFCLLALPCRATPAIAHSNITDTGCPNSCTAALTGVSAGNMLVAAIFWQGTTGQFTSVTDGGDTFAQGIGCAGGGSGIQCLYYICSTAKSGSVSITVNLTGSPSFPQIYAAEISGAATSGCLDANAIGTGTSTAPAITTSGNLSAANELTMAYIASTQVPTTGACCTLDLADGGGGLIEFHQNPSSGATFTANWTQASGFYNAEVWTIMAQTGGGGGATPAGFKLKKLSKFDAALLN